MTFTTHHDLDCDSLQPTPSGGRQPCNCPQSYTPITMESLADRVRELETALETLCSLKKHKDTVGKDGHYIKQQPIAWEKANQALNPKEGREQIKE